MMDNNEIMKLLDFILENKYIVISDQSLFSRDTLIMLRGIAKEKVPNYFVLSKEQEKALKEAFLVGNSSFNEDTPLVILSDLDCIKKAIKIDIKSIDYMKYIPVSLHEEVILLVKENGYLLNSNTPYFLASNYEICRMSIFTEPSTADYIDWEKLDVDNRDKLLGVVLDSGYLLHSKSCDYLKRCVPVVLKSLKEDKSTARYIDESVIYQIDVFKYLITNEYEFTYDSLLQLPIRYLHDKDILREYIKRLGLVKDNEELIDRYVELYSLSLGLKPRIEDLNVLFERASKDAWSDFISSKSELYQNVFGKICSVLRSESDYEDVIDLLEMLDNMSEVLDDRYYLLEEAMEEYHSIYHSKNKNRMSLLKTSQDTISKMCALYIAISKETVKKDAFDEFYGIVKDFYKLKLDHPHIKKRITQKRKMDRFRDLYYSGDKEVSYFIRTLYDRYGNNVSKDILKQMVHGFIYNRETELTEILRAPAYYSDYLLYIKVSKLVNRLNSGYISYDGIEMRKYTLLVSKDEDTGLYYYSGCNIEQRDIEKIKRYMELDKVFNLIKKDIVGEVSKINIETCSQVSQQYIDNLVELLPFNDEFFVFDEEKCNNFSIRTLYKSVLNPFQKFRTDILLDDETFSYVKKLFTVNYLIWLLIFNKMEYNQELFNYGIDDTSVVIIVNHMDDILRTAKSLDLPLVTLDNYSDIDLLNQNATLQTMAILGKDLITYLLEEGYSDEEEENLRIAEDLVARMVMKDKCTVPYINGRTNNYCYSMYDSQDVSVFRCGGDTDSCFRIADNDNDFLHYCLLHKDGFVIKITDIFGNFIGKASGFRNGNSVYINQLRTIYDEGGNEYNGEYYSEREDFIEVIKQAAKDIVTESYNNSLEKDKIDFVFITKSYALDNYRKVVSDRVCKKIGDNPMNSDCDSWKAFYMETPNLDESRNGQRFYTDYGSYPVICLASSKKNDRVAAYDIKSKDVPALYSRTRNKVKAYTKITEEVAAKINKIAGITAYYSDDEFEAIDFTDVQCVFIGDNWYMIVREHSITSTALWFDSHAIAESKTVMEMFKQYLEKYQYNITNQQLAACEIDINRKLELR